MSSAQSDAEWAEQDRQAEQQELDQLRMYAEYYRWLRENGCILLPPSSGDEMLTARMLEALDEKMASLVVNN